MVMMMTMGVVMPAMVMVNGGMLLLTWSVAVREGGVVMEIGHDV